MCHAFLLWGFVGGDSFRGVIEVEPGRPKVEERLLPLPEVPDCDVSPYTTQSYLTALPCKSTEMDGAEEVKVYHILEVALPSSVSAFY